MKKTLLAVTALLFITILSKAQTIPNGDFENWVNEGSYTQPVGWLDDDSAFVALYQLVGIPTQSYTPCITQVAGYNGGYAARLNNSIETYSSIPIDTFPGLLDLQFPNTVRPAYFTGYYQFNRTGTDTAIIGMDLTKWNPVTQTSDSLGGAIIYITSSTSGFTAFNLQIGYVSAETPDTIEIGISSTNFLGQGNNNIYYTRNPNSSLIVDQLTFSGTYTGVASAQTTGIVTAYPNPVTDVINFSNLPAAASLVEISDVTGRPVMQSALPAAVNVSALKSGVYIYSISASDGTTLSTSRFVK